MAHDDVEEYTRMTRLLIALLILFATSLSALATTPAFADWDSCNQPTDGWSSDWGSGGS